MEKNVDDGNVGNGGDIGKGAGCADDDDAIAVFDAFDDAFGFLGVYVGGNVDGVDDAEEVVSQLD